MLALVHLLFALLTLSAHGQEPPVAQSDQQVQADSGARPAAPIDIDDLPPELAPWVAWVTARHPELQCPVAAGSAACIWPGRLELDTTADGARLTLEVTVDRDIAVPLPGGPGVWPQDVRLDGRVVPVLDVAETPMVVARPGSHRITASYAWSARPQNLKLPPATGTVELTVDGERIAWPRRDGEGLRLGAGEDRQREGETLDLEVARKVTDGVPVVVETRITVRASGGGREVDLGDVAVQGTRPVSLRANLPARFDSDGRLVVQVRPGTYEVAFEATHDGPVAELTRPKPIGAWPPIEYWAVATSDRIRAVNLSGPTGIDAARTPLPEDWRSLPAYAVTDTEALRFEELRRGEPTPSPNQLSLQRELWLDLDGRGLTVRDRFTGALHQGWRLDVRAPAALGHVSDHGEDLVITTRDDSVGVELRGEQVEVVAESRFEERPSRMSAVGWATDVTSLSAVLHLPPGWTLLAGTGVDNLDGSVLDQWTLFDLFFVLVVALAAARLVGLPWGAVTLLALVLSRHEPNAPQWMWAVLVALIALERVVPEGWPRKLATGSRWAGVGLLAILLLPFSVDQLQEGLFPALEHTWSRADAQDIPDRFVQISTDEDNNNAGGAVGGSDLGRLSSRMPLEQVAKAKPKGSYGGKKDFLTAQLDPSAVVQTGPGVPQWTWNTQPLTWSGPVRADHDMRLVLIGPTSNLLLALARVALLVTLGLKLARLGSLRTWAKAARAGAAVSVLLLLPAPADATPSEALLTELEQRLILPPACAPHCVTVPRLHLEVADDALSISAEVHVLSQGSWPVPGPATAWVPDSVRVDGRDTSALARLQDGFLHVRLDPGVHLIQVDGALPPADAMALQFGLEPRFVSWEGEGWALDGLKADGTVERSVQLARMLGQTSTAQSSENLAPWLEVHRQLDLGIPWRVRTTVRRVGPADYPVAVKVPLLPGEAVTDSAFQVRDGAVPVTLDRDLREVAWLSTLEEAPELVLTAPTGMPWTEEWTLSCSPVFACTSTGPAPLHHVRDGAWSPVWRVWPGEQVTLAVARPEGASGQTVTIDRALLTVRPGRRQLVASLALTLRSSQGGRQHLGLPADAELQEVRIDGTARPIQARDGNEVHVPLQPGRQEVLVQWQQAHPPAVFDRVPEVRLGGSAVNATVVVEAMPERWVVALLGPRWGPTPLFWTYVLLVLLAAPILSRVPWQPLATWQWALLGLGMTQAPAVAAGTVVLWFIALGWRRNRPLKPWWAFDLGQLALVGLTLAALGCLYGAIHSGLLWQPDMQVAGNGSSDRELRWFVDRVDGSMPRPAVLWLPMWTWRVLMLAWSLWLAASLVRWLPWAWQCFATEGLVRRPPPAVPPAPVLEDEDVDDDPTG